MALPLRLATHRKIHALNQLPSALLSSFFSPCHAFAANQGNRSGKALNEFFEAEWNYEMEQSPVRASFMGDRRWNDRWGDQSLEAIRKREEHANEALARLKKFDRAKLSPADQLNYDLFQKDLETDIEAAKFRTYLMPIKQRGGIQTLDELGDRLRFETFKDFEDWIARLRAFPTLMDQNIALMREGAKAQSHLAEDRARARPGADRQAARLETGGKPVLQTVHEIPGRDPPGGPGTPHQGSARKRSRPASCLPSKS